MIPKMLHPWPTGILSVVESIHSQWPRGFFSVFKRIQLLTAERIPLGHQERNLSRPGGMLLARFFFVMCWGFGVLTPKRPWGAVKINNKNFFFFGSRFPNLLKFL
jgi:hypothetical protein